MRGWTNLTIVALFSGFALGFCHAQPEQNSSTVLQSTSVTRAHGQDDTLTQDDRLSLIVAALDSRVRRSTEPDCSHLVHAIYDSAGFSYAYAPSSELYSGIEGFERVKQPQPGDLIVWRGHVGIVIKPSQHIFFSFMSSGPGTDDYEAPYWKQRGKPRFYRYMKTACSTCAAAHSRRLVRVKR